MVPEAGFEPATPCGGRILSPVQRLTEMSIVTGILAETAGAKALSGLPRCLLLSDISTLSGKVQGKKRERAAPSSPQLSANEPVPVDEAGLADQCGCLDPTFSGTGFVAERRTPLPQLVDQFLVRRPTWRSHTVLGQFFFQEITRSAVPVDLRAIRQLQRSPLAIDLYVWLTYRMSYMRKPTVIPWESFQAQFGASYSRPRDFRRKALAYLEKVLRGYPDVRVRRSSIGLRLFPSPPHVRSRPLQQTYRSSGGGELSIKTT